MMTRNWSKQQWNLIRMLNSQYWKWIQSSKMKWCKMSEINISKQTLQKYLKILNLWVISIVRYPESFQKLNKRKFEKFKLKNIVNWWYFNRGIMLINCILLAEDRRKGTCQYPTVKWVENYLRHSKKRLIISVADLTRG